MYLEGFQALFDHLGGYPIMEHGHEESKRSILHQMVYAKLGLLYIDLDKAQAHSEGWGEEDEEYLLGAIEALRDLLNQFPLGRYEETK